MALFASHVDDFAKAMSYSQEYNSALSEAKKQDKVVMLLVVSNTCPWCRKFERETLEHATIDAIIKADFIPVIMEKNVDKAKFPKKYHAQRIPTVYFIDPNTEDLLFESMGFVRMGEYKETLEDIAKDHKGLH
jgi:thioredoxin-related protein